MAEQQQASGLLCRRCGGAWAHVVKTRRMAGYVVRRRQCHHCGYRYTTSERIVSPPPAPKDGF